VEVSASWRSGGLLDARLLVPDRKGLGTDRPVLGRRYPMAARPEVLRDGAIGGEKALGLPGRLEALHVALPLPCGPMRVLGAVVEIAALAMLDAGQDRLLGGAITLELVGHDDTRHILQVFQQLAEKALGCFGIAAALNQDVQQGHSVLQGNRVKPVKSFFRTAVALWIMFARRSVLLSKSRLKNRST
jgi:hypothetical protein